MTLDELVEAIENYVVAGVISPEEGADMFREIQKELEEQCGYDPNDPDKPLLAWFTFGFGHRHTLGDYTLDKDIVLEISAKDPELVMRHHFGLLWCNRHWCLPPMVHYPRGCIKLDEILATIDPYVVDRGQLSI